MSRSLLSLAVVLALAACDTGQVTEPQPEQSALDAPAFSKAAGPGSRASGGGTVDVPGGRSTYAFNARKAADGSVTGQVELHFSSSPIHVHGEISCLTVVGNQAWLGAVVTRSNAPGGGFVEGGQFVWTVVDNGEGNKAAMADQVSAFYPVGTADVCQNEFTVPQRDWTNGNVQVR